MRTIIGHSLPPTQLLTEDAGVRYEDDNSHKKIHNVRGHSSADSWTMSCSASSIAETGIVSWSSSSGSPPGPCSASCLTASQNCSQLATYFWTPLRLNMLRSTQMSS